MSNLELQVSQQSTGWISYDDVLCNLTANNLYLKEKLKYKEH